MAVTILVNQQAKSEAKVNPVYAQHLASTPIKGKITITHESKKNGQQQQKIIKDQEELVHPGVTIPPDQLYLLTVEGSYTINLGNFESARIGVAIRMPTIKADLEDAYLWCNEWISTKMDTAVANAKGEG
jgi:hypothetical protein